MFRRVNLSLLLLTACLLLFTNGFSQHFLTKRFRFGMSMSAGYTAFYKPSSLFVLRQKMTGNGGFDTRVEYQFTRKMAFRTGLGIDYMTFSEDRKSSDGLDVAYYSIRPRSFDLGTCNYSQLTQGLNEYNEDAFSFSKISSRVYNVVYLTIPVEVLFRKELKEFSRAYFKTGIHTGLRIYNKAHENGITVPADSSYSAKSYNDRRIMRDLNTANFNLVVGAGYEHSFGGHSSVFCDVELGFGLFNLFSQRQEKATLYTAPSIDLRVPATSISSPDMLTNNSLRQLQMKIRIGLFF